MCASSVQQPHVVDNRGRHIATVLAPLAEDSFGFWQSPTSGCKFPTRWPVRAPALVLQLEVTAEPEARGVAGTSHERHEWTCRTRSMMDGQLVDGRCYMEMAED
ncbi:lipocalin family protein [Sorangium sp. So ce1097]|uniref:lipocalin family protein n=1 Tax=Sorangium sp. So ce1097 TaxID=3133330 RepID=UPI003F63CDA8